MYNISNDNKTNIKYFYKNIKRKFKKNKSQG